MLTRSILIIFIILIHLINGCHYYISRNTIKPRTTSSILAELLKFFKEDCAKSEVNRVQFKIYYFSELRGWACMNAEPFIPNELSAEMRWALFRKENSGWVKVNWEKNLHFENDFELIDLPIRHSRIATLIIKNHPDCPMELFPKNLHDRGHIQNVVLISDLKKGTVNEN